MKNRPLDSTGDYKLGISLNNFLLDATALAQAIKTKLLLFQGEWWEDLIEGLPMFQSILGASGSSKANVDLLFQSRILSFSNIKKIEFFNSSLENRIYSFYCVVNTDFGLLNIVSIPPASNHVSEVFITTADGTLLTTSDGSFLIAGNT